MKYIITEEIESPVKVTKGIEFFDLLFFVCYLGVSFAFSSMVSDKLTVPFIIFSAIVALILTAKSPFNRRRRNFESIYFLLKNDRKVYKAIYNYEEGEKDERKK